MKCISDRDFAAAHDRYLEPPDDEPEDAPTPEDDDDHAYEMERQRELDSEWDGPL